MWELFEKDKLIYSAVLKQDCIAEALRRNLMTKVSNVKNTENSLDMYKLNDGVQLKKR